MWPRVQHNDGQWAGGGRPLYDIGGGHSQSISIMLGSTPDQCQSQLARLKSRSSFPLAN